MPKNSALDTKKYVMSQDSCTKLPFSLCIPSWIFTQISTLDEEEPLPKGIGLNLARTTIHSLGGKFNIKENEPQGTIVIIELPIYKEELEE